MNKQSLVLSVLHSIAIHCCTSRDVASTMKSRCDFRDMHELGLNSSRNKSTFKLNRNIWKLMMQWTQFLTPIENGLI
jgi:hypothetical protein